MVNEEKIDKLPNELYLILIGHVSPYIFEYIKKCNSGITREEYNYFEVESIKDSFEFKGLSKRIPNFIQKCKTNNYNKLIKIIDDFIIKYPSDELLYKCKSVFVHKDGFFILIALFLLFQVITNTGCCSTNSCSSSSKTK